jgi:hypothetical protein
VAGGGYRAARRSTNASAVPEQIVVAFHSPRI